MLQKIGFLFLASSLLFSCTTPSSQQNNPPTEIPVLEENTSNESSVEESVDIKMEAWERYQDSLKRELLNRKKNEVLKNSLLQEFYIRGLAKEEQDSVFLELPFDLHGLDAGAPDCYTTQLSFHFPLGTSLHFPPTLDYQLREFGCVDEAYTGTGTLELLEVEEEHVIYASENPLQTLILARKDIKGEYAFFFPSNRIINQKALHQFFEDFGPDDDYPYTSTRLTNRDYERFLD